MPQLALYRKYRPHNFDNLVGQDYVKTTLINSIKTGHISHAYLFSGPRGTGKTSTARLLAKALNCADPIDTFDPCDKCDFCQDINDGRLIDLIEIDAASNRGIDEVRDLREKINFAPTRAKYKVYIVDEVHMMTKEAFNALLKTLEEPPPHAYFILATTEVHKIPETIISRCQRFDFKRISRKALMTRLSYIAQAEDIKAEDKALEAISKYVDGSLRDAIGLLEQLTTDSKLLFEHAESVLGITDITLLDELAEALSSGDSKKALKIIRELHDQGSDLKKFTHEFINNLREKMLESVAEGENEKTTEFMRMIEIFQEAHERLHTVNIPQLPLEIAVIKIAGPVELETAVEKVEKEEKKEIPREHKSITEPISEPAEISFELNSLKQNWPRITERISIPASRMCLKNAVPVKVDGHEVTLQFNANFDRDKVMEHDNRVEVERVIKKLTGYPAKLLSVVKEIEIKPVVEEQEAEPPEEKGPGVVDQALNIFGGEVMD